MAVQEIKEKNAMCKTPVIQDPWNLSGVKILVIFFLPLLKLKYSVITY